MSIPTPSIASPTAANPSLEADTILTNADIYTEDEANPRAGVVAFKSQKIVYVGGAQDNGWREFVGRDTKVLDLHGRMVIPGITDSHTHPGLVVLSSYAITIPWTRNLQELMDFLKKYASEHPVSEVPFIEAQYYPSDMQWGPNGPTAAAIDHYVSDRPVIMEDWSGHSSVANSKALELMGVDKSTPLEIVPHDPAPQFVRAADGVTPTGFIYEGAWHQFAAKMFKAIHWSPPSKVTPELLASFTNFLSSKGVTSLFDAASGNEQLAAAAALDKQGKLNMNYHASLVMHTVAQLPENIRTLRDWQQKYGNEHIEANTIKLFLDGTNEIGTSAVLEPFIKGRGNRGKLRLSENDLVRTMLILNRENLDLHIHVLGDRGFRTILNAVETVKHQVGKDWKMRVTAAHADLVDPADMARVANLGVIVNWTPHWGGGSFGDAAADWLGYERFNRMTQFNPIIKSGGMVTFSSDVVSGYEAYRANPFFGMQAAHTRIDPTMPMPLGSRGPVPGTQIRPPLSARLSLEDLLTGYTRTGAYQLRLENSTGTIALGKMASLAILNQNLFKAADDKIRDVAPIAVIFEGRLVQGDLDAACRP
jgi:predicted amidohydrolase YtcJ